MGNNNEKVNEAHKLIVDLSDAKPISNDIFSSQFNSLLTLTQLSGFGFDIMVEIFSSFNELTLQKFLNNLLIYHHLSKQSNNYPLNQVFTYIHALFRTFRTKYNFNIKRCLYDSIKQATKENVNSIFPINLLKFSIETFISIKYNSSKENKNEQTLNLLNCLQIIHKIIFSYDIIDVNNNLIVDIDIWKFILGNDNFISKDTLTTFINDLYFYFFSTFEELVKNSNSRITSTTELNKYSLGIILYFFYDPNYFLFEHINSIDNDDVQLNIYFQDNKDFNECLIKYINMSTNNKHIKDLIISYRTLFRSLIESYMTDNYRIISDFITCLFDNYISINEDIRQILCYVLLELLYIMPTIIDKCGIKFFLFHILNELKEDFDNNFNFRQIILINKLFLTKTFKNLILSPNTVNQDNTSLLPSHNNNENNNNSHIEICIDYYLFFLEQMKTSTNINLLTLLILPINNLCILFPKMNSEENNDEFSHEYFAIVKKVLDNVTSEHYYIRILFLNCFIENILLLLNKLEPRSTFLLGIVKNFDYLNNQVSLIKQENTMQKYIDNINTNFQEIININTKINTKFKNEGIDWKYAQDNQLMKIINKIMFFETSTFQNKLTLKDISIHNNKIEKEILFSNKNEGNDIFNLIITTDYFSVSS